MNNLRHRLRFKINSGVACEKGTFHQLRAGVERARIVAHHCIHRSRVRSGLRMTRTAPVDPLSHSIGSRVKPLFVAWTISMDSIVPAVFATEAECAKWSADLLCLSLLGCWTLS